MKKYLHVDLIRILKENTDRDHPMKQKDLLLELRKKDEKINRTTVYNALNDLIANSPETRVHSLGEEAEAALVRPPHAPDLAALETLFAREGVDVSAILVPERF